MIGNLYDFSEEEKIDTEEFPDLEKYILHRLWEIDKIIQGCIKDYNFHLMFTTLLNFCSNDLSSFYFDIRKDTIYCDSFNSLKRRSSRTLLDILFNYLIRWLAPSLVFTCEEAWKSKGNTSSIHLEEFLKAEEKFKNEKISLKWEKIKEVRKVITGALEKKRAEKSIGSSLEAHVDVYLTEDFEPFLDKAYIAEISITSSANLIFSSTSVNDQNNLSTFILEDINGVAVDVKKTEGSKCERCWKFNDKINENAICNRCSEVINNKI